MALTAVDLALQLGVLRPHLLALQILLPHLLRVLLHGGVQLVQLPLGILPLADGGLIVRLELNAVGTQALQLLQPY